MVTRKHRGGEVIGRRVVIRPLTLVEELADMRAGLRANEPLTDYDRRQLDTWLGWMHAAIEGRCDIRERLGIKKPRGAPRGGRARWLALDFAIRKRIHGKDVAALAECAAVWGIPEKSIRDAYTDWRHSAEHECDEHLAFAPDRQEGLADLLKYAGKHLQRARSRKKPR